MIYFLYGADNALKKQRIAELADNARKENKFQEISIDVSETDDYGQLYNFLITRSLFFEKKLANIDNVFDRKIPALTNVIAGAIPYIKGTDSTIIIGASRNSKECIKIDKNLWGILYKEAEEKKEYEEAQSRTLPAWITKTVKAEGLEINSGAAGLLISKAGADTHLLKQEINKLVCYKRRGEIDEKDIELLVADRAEISGFAVVDALGQKQKARAIQFLHDYLQQGQDPHQLFGALVYQIRNMLALKSMAEHRLPYSQMQKELNVHPYVMRKSYDMSKKFAMAELESAHYLLAKAEREIKSGTAEIEGAIFDVIMNVG